MKDTRIRCPFCKAVTWMTDYTAFMREHDRPYGDVCHRGAKSVVDTCSTIRTAKEVPS